MDYPDNARFPWVASALAGFVICLAVAGMSGSSEAWDSPLYFTVGIPLMCVAIFAISTSFPMRAWRWTVGMAFGQSVALLLGGGSLSLWPLSLIALSVVSIPQFIAGFAASRLARRRGRE